MNKMPKRIQRRRVKGWRIPDNSIYVGRPSKWGNSFKVGAPHPYEGWPMTHKETCSLFESTMLVHYRFQSSLRQSIKKELKGKNLVCWCSLDNFCHADTLLKYAN